MTEVGIPIELFQAVARFALEHAPHNQRAEAIYNGLVVAFAKQQGAATDETPADDV